MKKLLSLALAFAMIMSIAVIAFAAEKNPANYYEIDTAAPSSETNPVDGIGSNASEEGPLPLKITSKTNTMNLSDGQLISYGNKFYFALVDQDGCIIRASDAVKSMSVKPAWENGADLVKGSPTIVKKKFGMDGGVSLYGYFIEIALNSDPLQTDIGDLIGTLTVKKSTGLKINVNGKTYFDVDVNIPIQYKEVTEAENMSIIKGTAQLYDFDQDEYREETEFEFEFEKIADAFFVVDVSSQKKIVLKATADFNASVASKFPYANLDFFVGNGASFNKIGELFLPADPGSFIYKVVDGEVQAVNAEYDSYDEGFYLKTRTLGTYVISDVELELAAATVPGDIVESEVTTPPEVNPTTGATV